ncbi:MAG: hypothetical protein NC418_02395 [Muribaculaceae bacterium]|nr:hypothetical protein [Muribaculaceae bacterium]
MSSHSSAQTPSELLTLQLVEKIQKQRADNRRVPPFAYLDEIICLARVELEEALSSLERRGAIEAHKNINHCLMFGIKTAK